MKSLKPTILKIILANTLAGSWCFALPVNSPTDTNFSKVCVGLDGIPISSGTTLYTTCCDSTSGALISSPPATCKGFLQIVDSTGGDAGASYNFALQTLQTASTLNGGGNTDFSGSAPPTASASAAPAPVTSAITSGGSSDPGASYGTAGAAAPASASDPSNGSGGGAAGAGGAGGALGSAGGGNAANAGAKNADSNNDKDSARLAYVQGDHAGDKAGSNSGGGVASEGLGESRFGQGNGNDANTLASVDDDGTGSPDDPSDYFSRTNKSDNLFKIVTNRYLKKKSLWKVKQDL